MFSNLKKTIYPFKANKDLKVSVTDPDELTAAELSLAEKIRKQVFKWSQTGAVQSFLAALLMLSLFMADAWTLGNPPNSQDPGLWGTLSFVFAAFAIESIVLTIVQPNYVGGFFFWMDILGEP